MRFYFLTRREREILLALLPIISPNLSGQAGNFNRRVQYHIDRFLLHLPPILRWLFHLGALFFDLSPILFLNSRHTFRTTGLHFQQYWVNRIYLTRLSPLYRWFHVIRGLILLFYYSQEEQQKEIGYSPAEWAKAKIMQRRRQLNLTEEEFYDPHLSRFQSKSP